MNQARDQARAEMERNACQALEGYTLEDVHEILIRYGLALPQRGSHWLTKKMMMAMYRGDVYCPKFAELKPRPCPKPPTRAVLVEELNKEIQKRYLSKTRCIVTTAARMPDQKWLLDALSALNAGHTFFTRSYTPDRPQDPYLQWKLQQIGTCSSIQHDLFRDLPPSLLVKRKSFKSMAPSTAQPQVSTFKLNISKADIPQNPKTPET